MVPQNMMTKDNSHTQHIVEFWLVNGWKMTASQSHRSVVSTSLLTYSLTKCAMAPMTPLCEKLLITFGVLQ